MATLDFIGQPFDSQLGPVLRAALEKPDTTTLWVATAWGKASGLTRIGDAILKAREERGVHCEIVLGVDENGATVEGLRLAMDVFDVAYVFHDPGTRTFHPKIYVTEGPEEATLIVGSGNLTKGGLYTNYEASTVVHITDRAGDSAAVAYLGKVRSFYDSLKGLSASCKVLNEESLADLRRDPKVSVLSEAARNKARAAARAKQPSGGSGPGMFGSAVGGLLQAPAPSLAGVEADDSDSDSREDLGVPSEPVTPEPGTDDLGNEDVEVVEVVEVVELDEDQGTEAGVTGFWKMLGNSDVSTSSSPGQIIIPIRFLDFFPDMVDETGIKAQGGAGQFDAAFALTFKDGAETIAVNDARAVLYVPAPHHPRQNKELRFTFRDRDVLTRLSSGDVLEFTKDDTGGIVVERRSGAGYTGRFAWL